MMGYAVAAVAAYAIWIVVSKILDEAKPVKEEHKKYWRIGQWITTGFYGSLGYHMIWQTLPHSYQEKTIRFNGNGKCSICIWFRLYILEKAVVRYKRS